MRAFLFPVHGGNPLLNSAPHWTVKPAVKVSPFIREMLKFTFRFLSFLLLTKKQKKRQKSKGIGIHYFLPSRLAMVGVKSNRTIR
tara:strand:+ start:14514 stop:14768 length:255 start_codon:yes stop_codon:yes gene_type:complete